MTERDKRPYRITRAGRPLFYADWDGVPAVGLDDGSDTAWIFHRHKGRWVSWDGPDVFCRAYLTTKAEFDRKFGKLPPLPIEADPSDVEWEKEPEGGIGIIGIGQGDFIARMMKAKKEP
jgi:hypothetical protein